MSLPRLVGKQCIQRNVWLYIILSYKYTYMYTLITRNKRVNNIKDKSCVRPSDPLSHTTRLLSRFCCGVCHNDLTLCS